MATSSEPKLYLLMGFDAVYDRPLVEFIDSLPATVPVCAFCRAVPSEHYKLACKHVFCGACFEDIVRSLLCPVGCKSMPTDKAVPKQTTNFETVSLLLVFCWNKRRGCPYTGDLAYLRRHFLGCDFYEVTCSLCFQTMPRPKLAAHFGAVHCKRRRSARHGVATGDESGDPTRAELTHAQVSGLRTIEINLPGLNAAVKKAVKAAAPKMTEDLKQHSEALFFELSNGVRTDQGPPGGILRRGGDGPPGERHSGTCDRCVASAAGDPREGLHLGRGTLLEAPRRNRPRRQPRVPHRAGL
ncbi:hypothetical protein HPB48_023792 [Haemaphysalis longicornis]|uniref:RING-type domain-containing protein n=1 Tax=Haemaphysalis longicornis TaxID=44386 RepID=A0A9J6H5T8_HAELO|nr:hypothetical protein HPB48_023792 [Haemaphysalis longicornis]